MEQPTTRIKLFFWLILGSLSVFFAEVISGSDMFPYFTPWGILVVMPLYTLHTLVLSYIVFKHGRARFYTLFIAGAIFGMYEAYITKVLWNPTWGDAIIKVGGIALVETIVLVLWWHPIMAFIIPLVVAEQTLTTSRETVAGLTKPLSRLCTNPKAPILLAIAFGSIQSANSPTPVHSIVSGISTTAFLILLIYLWRKKTNGKKYSLRELLPSKRGFKILIALLLFLYILTGLYLRPQALPGIGPQITIWIIYSILFILFYKSLKKSRKTPLNKIAPSKDQIPLKQLFRLALLLTISSAISKAMGIGMIAMILIWLLGGLSGILILTQSIRYALNKKTV